ncbi:MAG TPA: DUF4340 domain-containing protein [Terriglobia bacterium]|nr:DUF4340 domain-containing protein [Terriglobia bacterium]
MKFKGTFGLFIVLLVLGSFVYFSEFRGKDARQKQEESKKKAVQVEQKDITEISLIFPDRTITGAKKGEKQWQMTSPAGIEADSEEWDQLASNIARVDRAETVAENPQDLTAFGLKDPALKVQAKLADGKTIEILFGGDNPKKTSSYAKASTSNDVFLTSSASKGLFTKTVSDLRNKRVLELQAADVDALKILDGGKELEVQKSGENWLLKKPVDTPADSGEISSFLSSVQFARASSFPETPVDPKTAGIDPPAIRITAHDGKAKADRILLIGKTAETGKYYAKDASRDTIFIIEKEIPDKARRPVFDWRDKTVTRLDRDKIEQIEVLRGSEKSSVKKDGPDWKLPDGRKLQWDKVSAMLNTLEFEKAKDIIDMPKALSTYGLDKPRLEIVFRQGSNELARIAFGSESKSPEGIYAKTSDGPAVKVITKSIFDNFSVKVEDLVETPPAPPPAPEKK